MVVYVVYEVNKEDNNGRLCLHIHKCTTHTFEAYRLRDKKDSGAKLDRS